ncbi:hypothetical protein MSAN_00921300 [Mycena sanguinolenta]|uniref:Uncharacterized protein n=1 Tax=Mycena sanguinolenta TaxID=230812 RepID=A0A8H6YXR0_9AGAR|nr:hypothetical protein MSAN_00921300 [Mycena sanguinolenta]
MYAFKFALLVLSATAAYAYPISPKNPDSLAAIRPEHNLSRTLQNAQVKGDEKRQIHNADYQANGPPPSPNPGPAQDSSSPSPASPAPSEPAPKAKRFNPASWSGPSVSSSPRSLEKANNEADKRQIRNADYQANPGPTQESSSPANPPAAAPSSSAPQDKRTDSPSEHIVPLSPGSHAEDDDVSWKKSDIFGHQGLNTPVSVLPSNGDDDLLDSRERDGSTTPKKRSIGNTFGASVFTHRGPQPKLVSSLADDYLYGERRRTVEELTNMHNRNFNHEAVTRWSRAEVERMQVWSKLGRSNLD